MKPFSESPAHRMRLAYLRMHRVTNRVFRPYGVTADQYVVLRLLSEQDGMSQQELAKRCASDPTTLGRMLDLLEKKEYIERRQLEADRRTRLVFLTASGLKMVEQLYEAAESIRETIESAMSEATMKSMLRGLVQHANAFEKLENEIVEAAGASAVETSATSR